MQTINLIMPTCWQELTPAQLRYVFYLISTDQYSPQEAKTLVLFRWAHMEVIAPEGDAYIVKYEGKPLRLTAQQIAEVLPALSWLDRLPTYPVRLPEISGFKAAAADLQGLPFESYIYCDNLYQGFLHTGKRELLGQIAEVLYNVPDGKKFHLQKELQESMDAQIRALTKGDITKEEIVLKMDVWRALTELDAQAADAEEIKRQTQSL